MTSFDRQHKAHDFELNTNLGYKMVLIPFVETGSSNHLHMSVGPRYTRFYFYTQNHFIISQNNT